MSSKLLSGTGSLFDLLEQRWQRFSFVSLLRRHVLSMPGWV